MPSYLILKLASSINYIRNLIQNKMYIIYNNEIEYKISTINWIITIKYLNQRITYFIKITKYLQSKWVN